MVSNTVENKYVFKWALKVVSDSPVSRRLKGSSFHARGPCVRLILIQISQPALASEPRACRLLFRHSARCGHHVNHRHRPVVFVTKHTWCEDIQFSFSVATKKPRQRQEFLLTEHTLWCWRLLFVEVTKGSSGIEGWVRSYEHGGESIESEGKFSVWWGACQLYACCSLWLYWTQTVQFCEAGQDYVQKSVNVWDILVSCLFS